MASLLAKLFGKKGPESKDSPKIQRKNSPNIKPTDSMQAYPSYAPQQLPVTSPFPSLGQQQHYAPDPRLADPTNHKPMNAYENYAGIPSNHQAGRGGEVDILRSLANYDKIGMLGEGTFGRVYLVQHKLTQQFFALKVMKKATIIKLKQVSHVHNERGILSAIDCPFIVKLYTTFQDSENLFLLMEYMIGGELFHHLRSKGKFPLDVTIFYAAEIVVALSDLHERKIVYRDLKPENIMISKDGHVKICDFGFAKFVQDRTWTLCGTPEYLAPEVIQGEGHNQAADWWSLGVLIYELLAGFPPFYDPNPIRIYDQVLSGVVRFPAEFGPITRSLLSGLLTLSKSRRLGNLAGGARDVMNHEFFRHVNWDAVRKKQLTAPWKPAVKHGGDTSMFQMWQNPNASADQMDVDEKIDARFSAPGVQLAQQQAVDIAAAQFGAARGYGHPEDLDAVFRGF